MDFNTNLGIPKSTGGPLANGAVVTNTTLQNKWGLQVEFINLGGIITKVLNPTLTVCWAI
ncbi:hypothetical protein GCM10025791_06200 [Halioxenophilus aromaticivorans]|uniref:Uncharacterized protein n=1 Tax=Halioxenophilus aromaticivorans TaxID=1306992 RepID=A0AAV3TYH1_9ALTE